MFSHWNSFSIWNKGFKLADKATDRNGCGQCFGRFPVVNKSGSFLLWKFLFCSRVEPKYAKIITNMYASSCVTNYQY
jgi:hypothetical protein